MNTILAMRSFWKTPRFIPLRYRFILMIATMLIVLLGSLSLLIGFLQSRTMRGQLEGRGVAIAQSLAAASMASLLTYDYVALERSANQALKDPDITSIIFHDKEGRVAGYSGRSDLQNTLLNDEISQNALAATQILIQTIKNDAGKGKGMEIALPVYPPGISVRWGTIRVQLSLASMHAQIRQIQLVIFGVGIIALLFGTLVSLWSARRITRPLNNLMLGTQKAAKGNLQQDFRVQTGDEVEVLADNFNTMIHEIIAHRTQLEQQLIEIRRLQRYTEQLLTTMSDGLMTVDMNGRLSTMNPSAEQLLGIELSPIQAEPAARILKPYPELLTYVDTALADPIDRQPRELHFEKEGQNRTLLVSSSILKDQTGQPREVILNLHDISELKSLEASIRQAERLAALGTLAAGMAHEIRNPLSSIKTFVQLLPRKIEKPGFLQKFQRTVPRELNRINELVEDLLDLARVPKYTFRSIPVRTLIGQTMDALEAVLIANAINWRFECSEDLPPVQADSSQLAKAFHNLVRNAVQSMPSGGELLIKAYSPTGAETGEEDTSGRPLISLVFQDSGCGIPAEELKNIFNPFYTTKIKGTGLGLSITHKVITEHGGTITVTSQPDRGSCFVVNLPA